MLVWLAVVIPLIAVPVLYWRFSHRIALWEVLLQIGIPVILVLCSKLLIEHCQVTDTEFWGGWVTHSEYYEDWDERVPCRHPKYETYTDSEGNTHSRFVGYEHIYDVDYHPPYWQMIDSNGLVIHTSQENFRRLIQQFGNNVFVDLHRSYHSNDGDKYVTTWPNTSETQESVVTVHSYENRVQASNSIFNFQKVDPKANNLFEYPPVDGYNHQQVILGNGGPTMSTAEEWLQHANAMLGTTRQAKIFVLVFTDRSMQDAMLQEAYWRRGNKNEFVICIGTDKQFNVQWGYVFSWTEVELLKIEVRNLIVEQKELDLVKLALQTFPLMEEKWQRKHFRDFAYLTIDPPTWAVAIVFFLTLLASGGLSVWVVMNDLNPEPGSIKAFAYGIKCEVVYRWNRLLKKFRR